MFDPVKQREILVAPSSGYQRFLRRAEKEIDGKRFALGLTATKKACECCFCGLDEGVRPLAEFSQRSLREALKSELDTHPPHNRGHAYQSLGLGHWLLADEDDLESLEASSREYKASDAQGRRPDGYLLDIYLPYHLFAGAFEYVAERFERFSKSKVPKNMKSVRTSRVAAYVWAQYKLGGDYSREQADLAVKSFFDKELGKSVLGRGHYADAAIWLKLVYWNDIENPPSPRDVLRKAYDHMPDVARPF